MSFHAQRAGLSDPTPQLWLATASDTRAIAPVLEQTVREVPMSAEARSMTARRRRTFTSNVCLRDPS